MVGSFLGFTINKFKNNNCDYSYLNNQPSNNSVLVNINTGIVIEKFGNPKWIFVTEKNNAKEGWQKSSRLFYCIKKLEGKGGGKPSKQGEPVLWDSLQDHTSKFNHVLNYWMDYFSKIKPQYSNDNKQKKFLWKSMVDDYMPLDIKRKSFHPSVVSEWSIYNNTLVRYDDYGNILYGAAGAAFGLDEKVLLFGANLNQILKSGLDESKDTFSIQRGIWIFQKYNSRKNFKPTLI